MSESPARAARDTIPAWAPIVGLFFVAATFRAAYLVEYVATLPFALSPVGDSLVYLRQAADLVQDRRPSPALAAMSPLYGYYLWLTLNPSFPALPTLLQSILGLGVLVLVYRVVRGRFGQGAALGSVGLLMSYGVVYYFESKLLSESLGLALAFAGLSAFTSDAVRRANVGACVGAGALCGLAVLARASLVFALPIFVGAAFLPWARERLPWTRRASRAGAIALGIALVLGLNGAANLERSGRFVPVTMGSHAFKTSVRSTWTGRLDHLTQQKSSSPFDVVERAEAQLAAPHQKQESAIAGLLRMDVGAFLSSIPSKLVGTFSNRESGFQYGFQAERHVVRSLGVLPTSFVLLMLWGAVGAVTLARRRGFWALVPYLPWFLGCLVTSLLLHPSTRYRLGMIVAAVLLAGVGMTAVWQARGLRGGRPLLAGLAIVSVLAVAHSYTLPAGNRGEWHLQLAASYGLSGQHAKAREHAKLAAKAAPHDESVKTRARHILEKAPAAQ